MLNLKVTWNLFHLMDTSLLILKRIRLTCTIFSKNNSSCSIENDLIHLVKRFRFHVPQKVLFILHIRGDTLTALLKILNNPLLLLKLPSNFSWLPSYGVVLEIKRMRLTFVKFPKNNLSYSIENDLIHFLKPSRSNVWMKVSKYFTYKVWYTTHLGFRKTLLVVAGREQTLCTCSFK